MSSCDSQIQFPVTGKKLGKDGKPRRSTTDTAKQIWAAAMKAAGGDATKLVREKNWRYEYVPHVLATIEEGIKTGKSVEAARAALEMAYKKFIFPQENPKAPVAAAYVRGASSECAALDEIEIPHQDGTLKGDKLLDEMRSWSEYGCIESSAPAEIERAFRNRGGASLKALCGEHTVFLCLGATSELGPLKTLLAMGAEVMAISRPGVAKWKKLCEHAKETSGTLIVPLMGATDDTEASDDNLDDLVKNMGADLLSNPATIARFALDVAEKRDVRLGLSPGTTRVVVGTFVYLDSAAHVRATMACDYIVKTICDARENTVLQYLGSPATVHTIPPEAHADSEDAYEGKHNKYSKWWHSSASLILGLGGFKKNARDPVKAADGHNVYVFNGLVVAQGPNYALAKTLQMWRCIVQNSKGHAVVTPMTPPCKTDSVMHSPTMARAMRGMEAFPPLRPFDPLQVSVLMTMVSLSMIHCIDDPMHIDRPIAPERPWQLFEACAMHGGNWRVPYNQESIGVATVLAGLF